MNRQQGFTLLEVLIAIALASILLTSIYGVVSTTSDAKEKIESQGAALHLGRVLIARLDRELLGLNLENLGSTPALRGGINSLGETYIELLTNSGGGLRQATRQIYYRLGPDKEGQMTLWRAEKSFNSLLAAHEENLAHGIDKLSFYFFDGHSWRNEWNSLNNGQPMLVKAEFSLQGIGEMPPLVSVFDLPQRRKTP
ncbi:MAG: prepilin-type N-terminal cleavage/methylation domain-containing protein [Geopsychrobacter sp.]|nr:prepilin-type N-terminal cleavage/methylation domain-containing protein [Geopsychrobacter sp.]